MHTFEDLYLRLPEDIRLRMRYSTQDKIHHPEGTVETHTRLVFEYAQKRYPFNKELHLAAIFHDLGKPSTRESKIKDGVTRITNYGHEFKARKFIDEYFHLFADVSTDKEKVKELCANHMRAHLFKDGIIKKPGKVKAFKDLPYFKDIMKFEKCDANSNKKSFKISCLTILYNMRKFISKNI